MTTSAFSTIGSSFPFFKKGQILRNTDLNDLVNYLDEQDRQNRVLFVGIGIIGGLTHRLIEDTNLSGVFTREIVISSGYGLSSDGYLFQLTQECVTDRYRRIQVKENDFICEDSDANVKGRTIEWSAIELANQGELEPDDTTYADLADLEEDLSKHVLVLQWHRKEKDRKRCIDECDEKGADINFFIRKLLIKKEDLCTDQDQTTTAANQVEFTYVETYLPRFGTGMVQIRKENQTTVKGVSLKAIETYSQFYENYKNAVFTDAVIDQIVKAYKQAFTDFENVLFLDKINDENPFQGLPDHLKKLRDQKFQNPVVDLATSSSTEGTFGIQYFYDYLKDLILAYQQFMDVVCELEISENQVPDTCAFPGHLILGSFGTDDLQESGDTGLTGSGEDDEGIPGNEECRSFFQGSTLNVSKQGLVEEARFLYAKMEYLSNAISAPVPADLELFANRNSGNLLLPVTVEPPPPIRITPSKGKLVPLNKRSLPFYYSKILRDCWSYSNKKQGRDKAILGYHFWDESNLDACDNKPFCAPLFYDLEGYPFFRIEGHVGENTAKVFKELVNLRIQYNLPFSIQFLKLGDLAIPEDPEGVFSGDTFLDVSSLEVLFDKFRCDVEDELDKLTDPNIQTAVDEVRATLVNNLTDFDYQAFSEKLQTLIPSITDPNIIATLENIDEALYAVDCNFDTKMQLSKYVNVFHRFSEIFPGMEHLAGVPAGGTFIIVYSDFSEGELGTESKVVGDFCLPHACCDTFSAVPEPLISLLPGHFCSADKEAHEILVYPQGGTLEFAELDNCDDATGIFEKMDATEDGFIFVPDNFFDTADSAPFKCLIFRYSYYGQKAETRVKLYRTPEIEMETGSPELEFAFDEDGLMIGQKINLPNILFAEKVEYYIEGRQIELETGEDFVQTLLFAEGRRHDIWVKAWNGPCKMSEHIDSIDICPKIIRNITFERTNKVFNLGDLTLKTPFSVSPGGGAFRLVGPGNVLVDPPITLGLDSFEAIDGEYTLDFENLKAGSYQLSYRFPNCPESPSVGFEVVDPDDIIIKLEKRIFCCNDKELYPITIFPEFGTGNELTVIIGDNDPILAENAPFIEEDTDGNFFFLPAEVQKTGNRFEEISFIYKTDNGSATAEIKFYMIPTFVFQDDGVFNLKEVEEGPGSVSIGGQFMQLMNCRLVGRQFTFHIDSGDADVFEWQVNDFLIDVKEDKTEDFVQDLPMGKEYVVKLVSGPPVPGCSNEFLEVINVPCELYALDFARDEGTEKAVDSFGRPAAFDDGQEVKFFLGTGEFEIKITNDLIGGRFQLIAQDTGVVAPPMDEVLFLVDEMGTQGCSQTARYFLDIKDTSKWQPGNYQLLYQINNCPEVTLEFGLIEGIAIGETIFSNADANIHEIELTPEGGTLMVTDPNNNDELVDISSVNFVEVIGDKPFFKPSALKLLAAEVSITFSYKMSSDGTPVEQEIKVHILPEFSKQLGEDTKLVTDPDILQEEVLVNEIARTKSHCQLRRLVRFQIDSGAGEEYHWQVLEDEGTIIKEVEKDTANVFEYAAQFGKSFKVQLSTVPASSGFGNEFSLDVSRSCLPKLQIEFEHNADNNILDVDGNVITNTSNPEFETSLSNGAFKLIPSEFGGQFHLSGPAGVVVELTEVLHAVEIAEGVGCDNNIEYFLDFSKGSWVAGGYVLTYGIQGCPESLSDPLTFNVVDQVAPAVVTPPPPVVEDVVTPSPGEEADQPDSGGTRSAPLAGRSRSVSSGGPGQKETKAPAKKVAPAKPKAASKKATPTKSKATPAKKKAAPAKSKAAPKKTTTKKTTATTKKATPEKPTATKPKATPKKATPAKPKASPAKKKAAPKKATPKKKAPPKPKPPAPAEDLFALLNRRSTAQKTAMTQLAADKRLAGTASFGHANSFLLFPGGNLEIVNQRFAHDADLLIKNIKRAKGDREEQYRQVLTILLSNYLDKVVALDTENIPDAARDVIKGLLDGIKASKIDLTAFRRNWNGAGQTNKLKAKSADKFARLLR